MSLDSFQDTKDIIVQPYDTKNNYTFSFPSCTSPILNDGAIPYGTTIVSVTVSTHNGETSVNIDDLIQGSPTNTDNTVTVQLKYPSTSGVGWYHLTFVLTLNSPSGAKMEFDFNRIYVEDL